MTLKIAPGQTVLTFEMERVQWTSERFAARHEYRRTIILFFSAFKCQLIPNPTHED
jgi:hypothetical protein